VVDLATPDYRVQVSFRFGQFRDNMLNVRADDFEGLAELLDGIPENIADRIGSAEAAIGTVQMLAEATGGKVETVSVTQTASAGPSVPRCAHGARKFFAKADWQAYFCPRPKGASDQCDPIFRNDENKDQFPWQ
jgi:hypothetical protein